MDAITYRFTWNTCSFAELGSREEAHDRSQNTTGKMLVYFHNTRYVIILSQGVLAAGIDDGAC